MLTREAWNAFLKILEEPPPRVIFVLATTEPGKIFQSAPPILSRCQRFDFHRISTDLIRQRLSEVLEAEGVEADDAALIPIARKADGALRDALSGLDQVLAFSGTRIAGEDVRQVLGLVEEELYFDLFELLVERRGAEIFGYVERLVGGGYDLEEFYKGLGESLRMLLRLRLGDEEALRYVPEEHVRRYEEMAARFAPGDLLRMLSALAELDSDGRFRKSEQQRILLEVMLLKFAMLDRTVDLEELLDAMGGGGGNPSTVSGAPGSPAPPRPGGGKASASNTPVAGTRQGGAEGGREPRGAAGDEEGSGLPLPGGEVEGLRAVWQEMIATGGVLRPGQGIALRAAQVIGLSAEGELEISAAEGTPGAEVLADRVTCARLEEELSKRLGRPIKIKGVSRTESLPPRVNSESARAERLERLVDGHQGLQDLVERLDLELLD